MMAFVSLYFIRRLSTLDLFLQINLTFLFLGLLTLLYLFYLNKRKFQLQNVVYPLILTLLLNYNFAQFVLINVDRSRSFYVLSWVVNHEIEISPDGYKLNPITSREKVNQIAITQRIDEQLERGLIKATNSKLELTRKGKLLYKFADQLANIYHLQGWFENKY